MSKIIASMLFLYTQIFYFLFFLKQKFLIIINYLYQYYPIKPINQISIIEYHNQDNWKKRIIDFYDYLDDSQKYLHSKNLLVHEKMHEDKLLIKVNNVNNNHDNYLICNYTFLLVQIKYPNGDVYDITQHLNNFKQNFYLVGNILFDQDFIIWFSVNYFNINYTTYEVKIMDHSLEFITLSENNTIKLLENTYEIIS